MPLPLYHTVRGLLYYSCVVQFQAADCFMVVIPLTVFVGMQVAGNIHFAPGKSFQQGAMHTHDLVPFEGLTFDLSHNIDKLSFGQEYPGMANPLDRVVVPKFNTRNPQGLTGTYQYFLKVPCLTRLLSVVFHHECMNV